MSKDNIKVEIHTQKQKSVFYNEQLQIVMQEQQELVNFVRSYIGGTEKDKGDVSITTSKGKARWQVFIPGSKYLCEDNLLTLLQTVTKLNILEEVKEKYTVLRNLANEEEKNGEKK